MDVWRVPGFFRTPTVGDSTWITCGIASGIPTLQRAGLRPRDLYQCRHTFASLMLQAGEDPAWVAQMMGHTTTKMLYERYHRFIQHRTRQDGQLYLKRLKGDLSPICH